ncbi:general substrate transporter [Metschnikowia bicuspidata var. bicuspidata NRRL YB-4993]|uniref:General substrate transporter n=1 Tax=Metschnikowia bicuspidata var. bicuspidata NRRL YB-4993 TaxID=869754 RepID=A0A1A0HDN8_9ASCO|nr:general substrate transporter [Metschnikowia bicuspidata var. bicuspidata NRRL YB-4993]OBA22131.1 general substrate transporter [Metschnikowia bicuspidata var. bicuspidata NRRL YB-4993]
MSGPQTKHKITWRLVWATLISSMSTLQFGFHLAAFNAPQDILSCRKSIPGPFEQYSDSFWGSFNIDQCIPMDSGSTAVINTMFTVGGLVSSTIVGSRAINGNFGRKHLQASSALLFFVGSAIVSISSTEMALNIGRFLTGLAAGSCMVMAPILISELAPVNHRGLMGSLLQFGVGLGILIAQAIAFPWSNDQQWRNIFLTGAVLGLLQFVLLFTTVESPKWLILQKGELSEACEILHTLRTSKLATHREINHYRKLSLSSALANRPTSDTLPLLESQELYPQDMASKNVTLSQYISGAKFRKEWTAVAIIMTAQQLCGMNAITYYGVSVLSHVVPDGTNVLFLTSALAITNVVAALAVCPFIDRWGRRPFLLLSMAIMTFCSIVISAGLMGNRNIVAAIGCFGFVIGYSVGLGQIPFLMVNELSSVEAVGMAQSLGTASNWLANICVALLFPLLQGKLRGLVFLIFTVLGAFYFGAVYICVPETREKVEYDEIWQGFS